MIAKSEAAREVDAFGKRWGMPHLDLAKHAAFPLAIVPDLVYRLWATFRTDVTGRPLGVAWIAVADLLLSPLCSEVGHELFEMPPAIQRELLSRLQNDARFGHRRFAELAAFVASYYSNQLRSYHIGDREFAEDQRWFARKIAIAYVDPSGAVNELANEDPDDPSKLRVIGIASRLPPGVLQASARAASPNSPTAPSAAPAEGAGERGQFLPLNFAQSEALTEELRKPIEETISKYRQYLKGIGYHSEQDQVTVLIDPSLHDNAYYLPKLNQIVMAQEFALDPDAILREYTHHVLSYTKRDTDEPPWTSIASGLADYLPCSFNNKPTFAEKVALLFSHTSSHGYVRNLENIRRFDELKPGALQQDAGEVWGGAFWALRTRLGSEFIDPILFSAWSSWEIAQDSPESFVGFARSLVSAAASASAPQGETAESEVRATFERRGLSLALGGQTSHPDVGGDRESGVETDEALGDHIRVGDVLSAQGRLDDALSAYRAGLAIAERLSAADPSNAGWQRDLSVSQDRVGNVLSAQGRLDDALSAYRAGLAIREGLATSDPSNAGWQRDLSVSQNKVGDVLSAQGRLDDALSAYRTGLAIAERLSAADPSNAGWQRDLSVSQNRVGDVLSAQGRLDDALSAYRAGLAIAERLAAADPSNAEWQRDLSVSQEKLGDVLSAQGRLDDALSAYRAGLAIRERLAAADPSNAEWQRDLSVSQNKLGNVLSAHGKLDDALAAYRADLAIAERLAAADPSNAGWQRDLSVSQNKVGDVLSAQGRLDDALSAYRAGLAIAERLAAADPSNAGWRRDLSVSQDRVGDVLSARGRLDDALSAYRVGLAIRERLAAADPSNAGWQRDLSVSQNKLGDVLSAQGRLDDALSAYRAGLAIRERLAAADPSNAGWQRDLFISYEKLGLVEERKQNPKDAAAYYAEAAKIIRRLAPRDPSNARWQRDLIRIKERLATVSVASASNDREKSGRWSGLWSWLKR